MVLFPADSCHSKFAASIGSAVYDSAAKTITLADGVFWPDLKSNVLYIRHFYPDLWETVLNKGVANPGSISGAAILGTPGSEFL